MGRTTIIALTLTASAALSGCKTVEVAVDYPIAGVHVVAKFEAKDEPPAVKASGKKSTPLLAKAQSTKTL